jgi:hypothetical protein
MPLPGSSREPQFLQEIKEPKHETPNINSMTKKQLQDYAEELGLELSSKLNKNALLMEIVGAL